MQRLGEFQVFLDGGDFVVEPTTFFFVFVESILVGVDALFKSDQNIGELFQGHSPEKAYLLYMLARRASQYHDSRKWLACINERIVCMLRSRMLHSEDAQVSTDRLLSVAVEASAAAGKMLLNYARSGFHIQRKNPINLVTDADHAAEECIIDHIQRHFPSHRTLAEERGVGGDTPSRYRWIIDPLDGTTNFAHGFPFYAVSIGVECD